MSSLLEVRNLRKVFVSGGVRLEVLRDLSLDVEAGEMVAVTGVSGSGKSTLLHLLGAMDRPDGGSIRIDGRDTAPLAGVPLSAFRNRTIGFVFQSHHLLPEFSALENVMMPLLLRGVDRGSAAKAARARLADVGLEQREHHRPGELSGGEQQRVAVARALANTPRLLLADEPTGNLDPVTGATVCELLLNLHGSRKLTSIVVTHNDRLAQMCNRAYRLENGALIPRSG